MHPPDIIAAIGNTPLIHLRRASELTGCTLLGKAEFLNPGQSIKDRAALFIVRDALARGLLRPGGTLVEGSSVTEGIGQARLTANLEGTPIDEAFQVPDAEALPLLYQLLEDEGLCLGGSSAVNVAGAIRLARKLGPGHTIVTVLCDSGSRYASKLYNPVFLRSKGLPVPHWLERDPTSRPLHALLPEVLLPKAS